MPFYGVFEVQACVFWYRYLTEPLYCVFGVPLTPFYGVFEVQACVLQIILNDRFTDFHKENRRGLIEHVVFALLIF
jgi:hypothetical protein